MLCRRCSFFLCFAALLGLLGCSSKEPRHHAVDPDRLPHLEVVKPTPTPRLQRRIELSATVEAMEKVDLNARVPGVVRPLSGDKEIVDINRPIRAGEVLIRLEVPDLEAQKKQKEALRDQARQQKAQAEETRNVTAKEVVEAEKQEKRYAAEYTFRELENKRITELVRRSTLQPERLEESQRQLEAALAAVEAARAMIDTKTAKLKACDADLKFADTRIEVAETDVRSLQVQLDYATLRAPFDGVITKRWVDSGATIKDSAMPLLTVMRTDKVRVLLDVPERDVPLITTSEDKANPEGVGNLVTLRMPALSDKRLNSEYRGKVPNGEFRGTVTRLGYALDPVTRTMRAEMHLDNREGNLRPGMYGTAEVLLEERANVLTIPATALARREGKMIVYLVANVQGNPPRGVVQQADVELGLDNGRLVEVKGLTGNELVIIKGNGVVRTGEEVVPLLREP